MAFDNIMENHSMSIGSALRSYVQAASIIKLVSSSSSKTSIREERSLIDATSGGALIDKTLEQAQYLISNIETNF